MSQLNACTLTQAGGSATHFVKLVKRPSRENRQVSGLVVRQLTSLVCTITRADGTRLRHLSPVPEPTVPLTVLLCVQQGHAGIVIDSMLLDPFPRTRRRHSVHTTTPPWTANTDDIHVMVQDPGHMQQRP